MGPMGGMEPSAFACDAESGHESCGLAGRASTRTHYASPTTPTDQETALAGLRRFPTSSQRDRRGEHEGKADEHTDAATRLAGRENKTPQSAEHAMGPVRQRLSYLWWFYRVLARRACVGETKPSHSGLQRDFRTTSRRRKFKPIYACLSMRDVLHRISPDIADSFAELGTMGWGLFQKSR